jgi:hypothetical protein
LLVPVMRCATPTADQHAVLMLMTQSRASCAERRRKPTHALMPSSQALESWRSICAVFSTRKGAMTRWAARR